jgi:transcriptional regulator with XRE-family HTH domain
MMMKAKSLFGSRIKSLRAYSGLNQEALAERMDISQNYISSLERGKGNPTFDMIVKLAQALKVEMWELFDFGHEEEKKKFREILSRFPIEIDQEKLALAMKVLKVIEK